MDIERAKNKSPEDLASIWDDYHLGRGHIGASMNPKLYHLLLQRATDCFLQPLFCYSIVEREWLHYNVCSSADATHHVHWS
ncbi:hypothetical protein K2173_000770 [Erythroxylum novogranatense]|uniref:Uncharacterized protein n=1 Tax=Erythroxylum novogranatense TaxID=1862640 RepID=A0AAV8T2V5_9ROSI|nr:hypothetical protein K2173_000770 [Erythroxylum novogranatense]